MFQDIYRAIYRKSRKNPTTNCGAATETKYHHGGLHGERLEGKARQKRRKIGEHGPQAGEDFEFNRSTDQGAKWLLAKELPVKIDANSEDSYLIKYQL
jgi:hypothetical protein